MERLEDLFKQSAKRGTLRGVLMALTALWSTIAASLVLICCTSRPPDTSAMCRPADAVAFSTWRGITPGHTSESEIITLLGEPDNVAHYLLADDALAYHYYPRPGRCGFFTVAVQDGIVQSATEVSASGTLSSTLFSSLAEAGCESVVVTQTISSNPVYAYPELGVAFEVGSENSALVEQHFAPLSVADYLARWSGVDLRLDPAFNGIHTMERLSIEPGVTTQDEVEELLQPGARVNGVRVALVQTWERPGGLTVLEYELGPADRALPADRFGRITFREGVVLTVYFSQVSAMVGEDGHYLPELVPPDIQIYSLGDALRDYGTPSLVFARECEGVLLELRLVYPRLGLQVRAFTHTTNSNTYCLTLDSETPAILYFSSMSEEEFREQLPVVWHNDFTLTGTGQPQFRGCPYREVEWQGIAQFCEWDHRSGCLQP